MLITALPVGVENVRDLPSGSFPLFTMVLADLYDPIVKWFQNHPLPPVAVFSDIFLGWTTRLANELKIPRYVFSPSGALALSVVYNLWQNMPKRNDPTDKNEVISENIGNEIESWLYLKEFLGHDRVWAVGPLLPPKKEQAMRGEFSENIGNEIESWLDQFEDSTVVYVCFGSQVVLRNNQMEMLALGLEKSGIRFLWSYKIPTEEDLLENYGMMPIWFKDRVDERGFVVKGWVPQVSILMGADQFANADLLDELKVGTRVCEGDKMVPNPDELARLVAESVGVGDVKRGERARAKELSRASLSSITKDGSSCRALNNLVNYSVNNFVVAYPQKSEL
ncbi:hypothetical protein POM88_004146 [Heracleum sosnowskyi]|uniref:UDP-glycosyltransferase n=1 Tax=Heracleum sosnowskyi TaxID=360622 RepID=A0AAD8JIX7_9APIA|nr:hypothetical protein POM88_004146 [Heracleum sosnowskyi]